MRTSSLIPRGQGKGRSHLTEVSQVEVEDRSASLMNQPTSRVDYVCMMTSPKVGALFLLK